MMHQVCSNPMWRVTCTLHITINIHHMILILSLPILCDPIPFQMLYSFLPTMHIVMVSSSAVIPAVPSQMTSVPFTSSFVTNRVEVKLDKTEPIDD